MFFSLPVWGNGSIAEATKMDTVHTHEAHIIHKDPKVELNDETFKSLGNRLFRDLMFYLNVIKIFNILNSITIDYFFCTLLMEHSSQRYSHGTEECKFIAFKHNPTA